MTKFYFLNYFVKLRRSMKTPLPFASAVVLLFSFLCQPTVFAQLNSDGWTILNPSKASKVVYVSSSSGSDETGTAYALPSGSVGADPQNPSQQINAFKTIAAAELQVNNGEAAWILLKKGDTFYEGLKVKSGNSNTEPAVYSYYGEGTEPPLLKTGAEMGINKTFFSTFIDLKHVHSWIIGLSFYAHTRNPDDPEYVSTAGKPGFNFYAGVDKTTGNKILIDDILIEGCRFSYYSNNVINGPGIITNIKLRRNVFLNNYSETGHSQGLFTSNIDGVVLEENIFDHNGWNKQSINSNNDKTGGQATIFNHNTYFVDSKNAVFKGNSFYRPSSIGTKWTAQNGEASASNISITNNLYYDFEVGISIGGNDTVAPYRFKNIDISGNVFSAAGLSRPTKRTLGWHVEIDDWDGGNVSNNLLIHQNSEEITNGWGVKVRGYTRNVQLNHNILYNLKHAHGMIFDLAHLDGISITDNELGLDLQGSRYFVTMSQQKSSMFESNTYYSLGASDPQFRVGGTTMNFEGWKTSVNEQAADTVAPDYPAPDRSVELYVSQVLGLSGMEAYYAELRKLSKLNWKNKYTAPVINAWIKEGFGVDSSEPTDLYALTVANGTGSGNYEAGTTVPISANEPTEGQVFDRWTGDVTYIENVDSVTTTVTMPAANVAITATYKTDTLETQATMLRTASAPEIDGVADLVWENVPQYSINHVLSGAVDNTADLSGTFRVMWDEENLYFLVDVKDDVLVPHVAGENKWNYDGIEIFIDGDYSRGTSFDGLNDFQFTYNQGVKILSSNPVGRVEGMETGEVITEEGYLVEIKMPWSTLNATPEAQNLMGLDIALNDNDGNSTIREGYKIWYKTQPAFWGNTSTYGTANFIETFHTLETTSINGSVSVDPQQESYMYGQRVTLTATPSENFEFEGWNGDLEGDQNPLSLTMNGNKQIHAIFTHSGIASIVRTVTAPILDGEVDGIWKKIPSQSIGNITNGDVDNEEDLSGTFKMMWDQENLYVLIDVKDQTLVPLPEGEKKWNFDGFEIFFDGDYSRGTSFDGVNDFQFTYNQGVEKLFSNPDGHVTGMEMAEVVTPGGYRVELKMPWATLNTTPGVENKMGLEVALNDNDDPSSTVREGYKAWNATSRFFWGNTSMYGTAMIMNESGLSSSFKKEGIGKKSLKSVEEVVHIYPNPSKGVVTVIGEGTIIIRNSLGKIVSTGSATETKDFDLSSQPAGLYIIQVSNNNKTINKKLLIE